jgi:nucleoside-diphosphate-sugar epimerase
MKRGNHHHVKMDKKSQVMPDKISQSIESGREGAEKFVISSDDRILVTGAAGFIGSRVVKNLIARGFRNIVCFTRPSSSAALASISEGEGSKAAIRVVEGNLLLPSDCEAACKNVSVVYHLAAGTGQKSFPDAFMNSVVTTRNLLEATLRSTCLRRFVLVSSFSVYSNRQKSRLLDETCPVESHPELRGDAYCFAKVKQEEILAEYGQKYTLPYVIVRPGSVYGDGKDQLTGRVGLGTFGLFLHMGGSNTIPFTHVENCADAIVLAGLVRGVEREIFNVVDDRVPSSRTFLRLYKENVRNFKSIYVPQVASRALCYLWETYSRWSKGQLPPAFNQRRWHAEWRKTRYSNEKLKTRLGWSVKIPTEEAMRRYFQSCVDGQQHG